MSPIVRSFRDRVRIANRTRDADYRVKNNDTCVIQSATISRTFTLNERLPTSDEPERWSGLRAAHTGLLAANAPIQKLMLPCY
eukprot:1192909-Prorocentrum_minimum.AAC.5